MKRKISQRNADANLNYKENKQIYSTTNSEEMINPFKRVTRSSLKQVGNIFTLLKNTIIKPDTSENASASSKTESVPISKCPYVSFIGEIKYFSTIEDITKISNNLYEYIELECSESEIVPISFDMEWPFNFKTGPSKTAVLQLSICGKICYIFSVNEIKDLPNDLVKLLYHPKVILHGVNIKNDLRKLGRDFKNQINSDNLVNKCIDLGGMYNEIRDTTGRWSLEKLVNKLCRLQIDKSMKIRMSKWNVIPLEEHQLKYAANDVYIGHVIYEKLKILKEEKLAKIEQKAKTIETEV